MNYLIRRNENWNPLAEFRRELDGLFDGFLNSSLRSEGDINTIWSPAYEAMEEDTHFLLSVEMPGIPKDDIKIEVANDTLSIMGERRYENKKKENGHWHGERRYGKFQRTFSLPPGVDAEKIEANYQDGVLHLMVPKAESAKPRQIKIGTGPSFFGKLLGDSRKKDGEKSSETKVHVV